MGRVNPKNPQAKDQGVRAAFWGSSVSVWVLKEESLDTASTSSSQTCL